MSGARACSALMISIRWQSSVTFLFFFYDLGHIHMTIWNPFRKCMVVPKCHSVIAARHCLTHNVFSAFGSLIVFLYRKSYSSRRKSFWFPFIRFGCMLWGEKIELKVVGSSVKYCVDCKSAKRFRIHYIVGTSNNIM